MLGISCFEEPQEEEELVAAPNETKKKSPLKKNPKRSLVKSPPHHSLKSSKKLIPAPPPHLDLLPTAAGGRGLGALVDMMPLTPDKELAFFELLHSSVPEIVNRRPPMGSIMMFVAEYHVHLAGKRFLSTALWVEVRVTDTRNNAGKNAACYVHELDPETSRAVRGGDEEERCGSRERAA